MWVRGQSWLLKMVPFESLAVVSCSPFTVTMVVSLAICEPFSVKERCDLENRVRVHSRSLKMAPFDRSHTFDVDKTRMIGLPGGEDTMTIH